jgi:hypothetical protein
MGKYAVFELPAPVGPTDETGHDRCAKLGDSFIDETPRPDDRRGVARVLDMVLSQLALEGAL